MSQAVQVPNPYFYRTPHAGDAAMLAALGRETFSETFGHLYSAENLTLFLDATHGQAAVSAELANPQRLYRLAESFGLNVLPRQDSPSTMVGYCKLGLEALDGVHAPSLPLLLPGRRVIELKQLYLRSSCFSAGVGDALMQWALAQARALGAQDVILSVYSDNPRAQRFYQRYGFAHAGDCTFAVGRHLDHEYLYRLQLD